MKPHQWHKSTRCETYNCVEVNWFKSSRSAAGDGNCVEVGTTNSSVLVRDSKLGDSSPILSFTPSSWDRFINSLK